MALREPYLTDNPFRLLGLPSETPYGALRREADAHGRRTMAGLPHEPMLRERLGNGNPEDVASQVRALAADGAQRTVYRLMWPFEEVALALVEEPDRAAPSAKPYTRLQARFVASWLDFVGAKSVGSLERALVQAHGVLADPACEDFLAALLAHEDGTAHADARKSVVEAKERISRHLLQTAASIATREWQAGRTSHACEIAGALLQSPFDDALEERCLSPLVAVGESLAAELAAASKTAGESTPLPSSRPSKECEDLILLADAIGSRHPSVGAWRETVDECHDGLGWSMRSCAINLANDEGKNSMARDLIVAALAIARDSELKERLKADLTILDARVAPSHTKTARRSYAQTEAKSSQRSYSPSAERSRRFPFGLALYGGIAAAVGFILFGNHGAEPSATPSQAPPQTLSASATPTPPSSTLDSTSQEDVAPSAPVLEPAHPEPANVLHGEPTAEAPASARPEGAKVEAGAPLAPVKSAEQIALEREYDELKPRIATARSELASLRGKVDRDSAEIEEHRRTLKAAKDDLDATFLDRTDEAAVAAHNSKVDDYESLRNDFNRDVDAHNVDVDMLKAKVGRLNEKVGRLNALATKINGMNGL